MTRKERNILLDAIDSGMSEAEALSLAKSQGIEPLVVCEHCLEAIKSRGEKIRVLFTVDAEDYRDEFGAYPVCEWCEEVEECELFVIE